MAAVLCEWGLHGVEALRRRVSILVIVDVLSFSTAVDVAVGRGAEVAPFALGDRAAAQAAAARIGATLARPRREAGGDYSLSPASLRRAPAGLRLMLPSPNGSRLSLAAPETPVLAGCLRNAEAVARRAREIAGDGAVGVVPAGERWPDGGLRPAIEDWLGAGAVIAALGGALSAEARLAATAHDAAGDGLEALVAESVSGRELRDAGFGADVGIALERGVSDVAPRLRDGLYRDA